MQSAKGKYKSRKAPLRNFASFVSFVLISAIRVKSSLTIRHSPFCRMHSPIVLKTCLIDRFSYVVKKGMRFGHDKKIN